MLRPSYHRIVAAQPAGRGSAAFKRGGAGPNLTDDLRRRLQAHRDELSPLEAQLLADLRERGPLTSVALRPDGVTPQGVGRSLGELRRLGLVEPMQTRPQTWRAVEFDA